MASDVFVSHSIKDKAVAEAIMARLEADSVTCWIAPRDVVPGADWGESIIDAIESSRIMVLIFSRNADASPQIKREVERAVNKGVYIIPFRVGHPAYKVAGIFHLDFAVDGRLLAALGTAFGQLGEDSQGGVAEAPSSRRRRASSTGETIDPNAASSSVWA